MNQSLSDSPLRRPIPSIQGPPLEALFRQQLEKTITDADGDHRGKFLHDTVREFLVRASRMCGFWYLNEPSLPRKADYRFLSGCPCNAIPTRDDTTKNMSFFAPSRGY